MLDNQKQISSSFYTDNNVKYFYMTIPEPNRPDFLMHWHDSMELLLIRKGTLKVNFKNEVFYAKPGELVIIPPKQPHEGTTGPQGTEYSVLQFNIDNFFNHSIASDAFLKPLHESEISFCNTTDNTEVIMATEALIAAQELHHLNPMRTFAKVYDLLGIIFDNCTFDNHLKTSSERFSKVFGYIDKHYSEKISLNVLSKEFGYDKAYFSRNFKAVTGLTVTEYILSIRFEHVLRLMRESNLEIGNIASSCGFTDFSYFSHLFKKKFGTTPTKYREKINT